MSGPTFKERIYNKNAEELSTIEKIKRFRYLADWVEDGYASDEIENGDMVANLLRAKADKIEAALKTVEKETQFQDFQNLIKAVEWTMSMDYAPNKIQESWEEYGDKNE